MRKKNHILNRIFIFIFSIVCVAVCVCVAEVFASVLTIGSLNVSSNSTNNFSDFKVYAISLGDYLTKATAQINANNFRQKNAGAYILEINGLYHVMASAYEKENDARLVQENLLAESITSKIVMITFNQIELKSVSSMSQEREFVESLNIFKFIFLNLYDVSVSLDTNVINESKAKIEIISTKASVEERLENINRGITSVDGIYYQIIKNKYRSIINTLDELKNYEEIDGVILSAKIKYTYLYLLDMAQDLIGLLNNEI